jgi:hypothetical protein
MTHPTLSYVLIILHEGNQRHELWGTAKVYGEAGIRYSMRVGKLGVTHSIPDAVPLPAIVVSSDPLPLDAGYGLAAAWESGEVASIVTDETWLDGVLALIRRDYDAYLEHGDPRG